MFIPYRFLLFYTNATITLYKILACINITDINHSIHEKSCDITMKSIDKSTPDKKVC